ncbi:uncharacterized protein EI90DRAFT_3015351 [Cantharellus anzutake]|uniref:uncharacterized protein n=1 Tax=Cantharellus anzutake TaxID=1750568 RepID=UPI001903F31E|nr:uncharacterized protein EI90DRAFT_3015351 [Cantharellus anzutake]KAF8333455.1 hypothetical protein EI90DRAFT_3015351 [Cantharellus anzutake]
MRFWNSLFPTGLLLPIVAADFHGGILTQDPLDGSDWSSIWWVTVASRNLSCKPMASEIHKYASTLVPLGYPLKFNICDTTVTVSDDLNYWNTNQASGDCFRTGPDPRFNAGNCSGPIQNYYDKFFCAAPTVCP